MSTRIAVLATVVCASFTIACGDVVAGLGATTTIAVACDLIGPTVIPSSVTLKVGDTVRFKASPPSGCGVVGSTTPATFRWRVSNTALATIDSASGLLTALKPGSVTAIAMVVQDTAIKGAAVVTINP